jgi:hypothetical protein
MGPSGSGKTTLLDLLAGRKTVGKTEGHILFAGNKPTRPFLRRYTGYVEQFGACARSAQGVCHCIHDAHSTALLFLIAFSCVTPRRRLVASTTSQSPQHTEQLKLGVRGQDNSCMYGGSEHASNCLLCLLAFLSCRCCCFPVQRSNPLCRHAASHPDR